MLCLEYRQRGIKIKNENRKCKSYARLHRHINKMMIIKVATDATVVIIIITFLSSSGEFWFNVLSEPSVASIAESVVVLFVVVIIFVVVVAIIAVAVVVLADVLGAGVVDKNRVTGSWIKKTCVNIGIKFLILAIYTLHLMMVVFCIFLNFIWIHFNVSISTYLTYMNKC